MCVLNRVFLFLVAICGRRLGRFNNLTLNAELDSRRQYAAGHVGRYCWSNLIWNIYRPQFDVGFNYSGGRRNIWFTN